ncbi:MAG: hypothetical protein HYR70_02085 [Chloroflexi bacterium]|nr:hypothetical protein [Chloroflexota bacterium]MBI3341020.1 hypothetical protein [Chloroflexota bacterium]
MYRLPRSRYLGIKLNQHEDEALILWANNQGLDKSVLVRQILHAAFNDRAPRDLFPAHLQSALGIPPQEQP